jgi:hypothetical protein
MTVWRSFVFTVVRRCFFAEPDWRDARISKPAAWGRLMGPVNHRRPQYSGRGPCAAGSNEPPPHARSSRMVCDGAATFASPSAKSLVIHGELACATRCTERTHRGSCSTPDRRSQGRLRGAAGSSVGGSQTFVENLGCLVTSDGGTTHASDALIPRIGSKEPVPAASVGFTKREARVMRVTWIITRLSPWSRSGTIRSAWLPRAGFVKSARLRWTPI